MKKVLIIDDSEVVQRLIGKIASEYDASAVFASDGFEATMILRKGDPYDVIILDLLVPHICGWDILSLIKQTPAYEHTAVVILTAAQLSRGEEIKLEASVTAVLSKELFCLEEFKDLLRTLINTSIPHNNGLTI